MVEINKQIKMVPLTILFDPCHAYAVFFFAHAENCIKFQVQKNVMC